VKKGYFFSLDAFVAIIIIGLGIYMAFFTSSSAAPKTNIFVLTEDIVNYMTSTKIYEINDDIYPYIKYLKNNDIITDNSNTLMEQIGEFYVTNKMIEAGNFAQNLTRNVVSRRYSYQILINNTNIYNETLTNQSTALLLISSKAIVMGMLNHSVSWGPLDGEVRVWY